MYWRAEFERNGRGSLGSDDCQIDDNYFFRGLIQVPVLGVEQPFEWGVWVSQSEESFTRAILSWETPGREHDPPTFGWLSTELTLYEPSTLNLATMLHRRPVGLRPLVVLEPTDHPLAVDQRDGITLERVREIATALLHPER